DARRQRAVDDMAASTRRRAHHIALNGRRRIEPTVRGAPRVSNRSSSARVERHVAVAKLVEEAAEHGGKLPGIGRVDGAWSIEGAERIPIQAFVFQKRIVAIDVAPQLIEQ